MKKLLVAVIIIGIAILMALTVPDKKAHKEAMMKAVKEYVDEEAEERGIADNGITRFGKNVVNKAIEGTLGTMLKVNNYYLFNTTHVKFKGKDQLKGRRIGVQGVPLMRTPRSLMCQSRILLPRISIHAAASAPPSVNQ